MTDTVQSATQTPHKRAATATMWQAFLAAPRTAGMKSSAVPEPGEGEVRIRLEGCGLCASSLPLWQGRDWFDYPRPGGEPGHEGWGIVDRVGPGVADLTPGDRVTAISYRAFAEYDLAPASAVVRLPFFLDDKPFPGEALGCAMNVFSRCEIERGQTVAIVGAGFLGLLLTQLAKAAGATVIAVSKRPYSLKMAGAAGADHCVEMDDHHRIIAEVRELTGDRLCDRVIEVTGVEWPLNLAIELTRVRGRLIVAGFHQDGMRSLNVQMLNWRGIDMISAHERETATYVEGIRKAISAVREGKLDPFPLFTHRFGPARLDEAFRLLEVRPDGFVKALIEL